MGILELPDLVMVKLVHQYCNRRSLKAINACCKSLHNLVKNKSMLIQNSLLTYDFNDYDTTSFDEFIRVVDNYKVEYIKLRDLYYVNHDQMVQLKLLINQKIKTLIIDAFKRDHMNLKVFLNELNIVNLAFDNCRQGFLYCCRDRNLYQRLEDGTNYIVTAPNVFFKDCCKCFIQGVLDSGGKFQQTINIFVSRDTWIHPWYGNIEMFSDHDDPGRLARIADNDFHCPCFKMRRFIEDVNSRIHTIVYKCYVNDI
jgi:hypothetical protein